MTTYIAVETGLQIFSNAYLTSIVLLMAISYMGLAAIEKLENIK